jgi:hypothetical protein
VVVASLSFPLLTVAHVSSGGGSAAAVESDATVRSLQAQLATAQQDLHAVRLESSKLRTIAEQLSEERLSQDARVAELESRLRVLEVELSERPTVDELSAIENSAAQRVAEAEARAAELSVQATSMRETLISEQVEQLVAQVRSLEVQLAERPDAQQVAELEVQIRAERARADAAAAAAAQKPAISAIEAAPTAMRVTSRAPPSEIENQLRRIELLLQSIPEPELTRSAKGSAVVAAAGPVAAMSLPSVRVPRRSGNFLHPGRRRSFKRSPGPTTSGGIRMGAVSASKQSSVSYNAVPFQRAPAGSFRLRRHLFKPTRITQ